MGVARDVGDHELRELRKEFDKALARVALLGVLPGGGYGAEGRGSWSHPGLVSWPCESGTVHWVAASSGTSVVRLRTGWWPKITTSSSAVSASSSSFLSHWNCGSSMLPLELCSTTPPSELVSIEMNLKPGGEPPGSPGDGVVGG